MSSINSSLGQQAVRKDFVPKEGYISREWAELEAERLWPRVWQVACRLEEIPRVGDYVTYDILDESFIVVRTSKDDIKAFYNVCRHRGRRIMQGCGQATTFMCRFHGWTWRTDGSLLKALDHDDWTGCPQMGVDDLRLKEVMVDMWGGFVFINMDPNAESLRHHLGEVPDYLDCLEFEKLRYRWYKSLRIPCNWKTALEAFNEGYHIAGSHPQLLGIMGDDETRSFTHGKHGMFGYPTSTRLFGAPSKRTGKPVPDDLRPHMVAFFQEMEDTLKGIFSARDNEAARRILTEVPAGTPPLEIFMKCIEFQKEASIAAGAGWPDITFEQLVRAGTDWHIFPNLICLPYIDAVLSYRSRPDPDDPNWCIFDIWSLARYAPGAEPPLTREFYYGAEDYRTDVVQRFGLILSQDLQNMSEVQRGMKSRSFEGARTNPLQESAIPNFHETLYQCLFGSI